MGHFQFFEFYLAGTIAYAALRGGAPERITALLFVFAWILSLIAHGGVDQSFANLQLGVFLIDLALFAALYTLSILTTRFWPIWMAALQGLTVLSHSVILTGTQEAPGYGILIMIWSYPMLALLIVATWRHRRRLKRHGADPAWVSRLRTGQRRTSRRA